MKYPNHNYNNYDQWDVVDIGGNQNGHSSSGMIVLGRPIDSAIPSLLDEMWELMSACGIDDPHEAMFHFQYLLSLRQAEMLDQYAENAGCTEVPPRIPWDQIWTDPKSGTKIPFSDFRWSNLIDRDDTAHFLRKCAFPFITHYLIANSCRIMGAAYDDSQESEEIELNCRIPLDRPDLARRLLTLANKVPLEDPDMYQQFLFLLYFRANERAHRRYHAMQEYEEDFEDGDVPF